MGRIRLKRARIKTKDLERAAESVDIRPPRSREPFGIRLLAFAMVLGGLSVIGSVFASVLDPAMRYGSVATVSRLAAGLFMVIVAYGILTDRGWAIWAMGLLVFISAFTNPVITILLAAGFVFLLLHRRRSWFQNLIKR